jgi:tRNA A37 threonylcarbamoyladenosine dehydratase
MGNRIDPRNIEITKLNRTINDPLAKKLRNLLKDENVPLNIPVVCSSALPIKRDKHISSMIMVPATAGIYMAYYVINDILDIEQ